MTTALDIDLLERRMARLDQIIAGAQAEQAALWTAIRAASGRPMRGPVGQVSAIVDACAAEFGVPRQEMLSDRRHANVVTARQAACWLARALTTLSYPVIARHLRRDHTTVMHSVQAAELRIGRDGQFAHQIATLQAELAARLAQPQDREAA